MAQHGSLREGTCAQRAAAIRPAKMASAMGREGACPRPTVEVPSIWGASEIREHARACIGSRELTRATRTEISAYENWAGGDDEEDDADVQAAMDGPAEANSDVQQPAGEADGGSDAVARDAARGVAGDKGAGVEHRAASHTAEDVHMSEAGASSDAGHATPEGARADAAATPTRTSDTLHMHSVAGTTKRSQKRKGGHLRAQSAAEAALTVAIDEHATKSARAGPHRDGRCA